MNYRITHPSKKLIGSIELTASKSESNRALIIQALCSEKFEIKNIAAAEDTRVLNEILQAVKSNTSTEVQTYNVGAAGTTMRFLTAYFSTISGTHVLTGSERMKNRPIGILVNALRELGADIEYLEKEGFPPLRIKGKELNGGEIEIDGSVSSQYISALLLISPQFKNGLELKFKGDVTSIPYITMTLKMMQEFGVKSLWEGNTIGVSKQNYHKKNESYVYKVEGDWSSASYWYAIATLSKEVEFKINGLNHPSSSLQGDVVVADIFSNFGIKTEYIEGAVRLTKAGTIVKSFNYNFSNCPDLAQTIAIVVSALQIPATFTGLNTLRIKETDRTAALKNELAKLGTEVNIISDDEINIKPAPIIKNPAPIATYEDHRMAMAFAVFALACKSITIQHPDVVWKSYPDFWRDLKKMNFIIEEV
jgi:3-phosphoshikimate 1-carboxyvinyltransferase